MARQTSRSSAPRVAPRDELVNVPEFEAEAARVLPADLARVVTGGDRAFFERITFRPRMMVNCVDLNLSVDLFGQPHFAPIVVGPVADQRRFHAEGELATARGASAAKAAMVVSRRSSTPLGEIAAQATMPLLFQVFSDEGAAALRTQAREAEQAGCRAIVVTVGGGDAGRAQRPSARDWAAVDAVRDAVALPVAVKGVTTAAEATTAATHGASAVIVSNYGQPEAPGRPSPLEGVPAIVAAVGPDLPVLVDGGIRRGTDVMKALAFGARGVLVARPVIWGLAAYGADGVQAVVELLQTELARVMGCCGTPTLAAITPAVVKVHRPAPSAPGA
jgi:4-hydroxymandelate oxidase